MITKRIIPCLDVKNGRVVKGVNFEGLSDVSSPVELGQYYSECGADELVFYDITASSEGRALFTDILREEWGFDGLVVTDWGALNDRIAAFEAGCDLNMPGGSNFMEKAALAAVRDGRLSEEMVDRACERILKLVEKGVAVKPANVDFDEHHGLARRIAAAGAVLLKNEDNILPTSESDTVLIGYMASNLRYQGSGSSHINPTKLVNISDAMSGTAV